MHDAKQDAIDPAQASGLTNTILMIAAYFILCFVPLQCILVLHGNVLPAAEHQFIGNEPISYFAGHKHAGGAIIVRHHSRGIHLYASGLLPFLD